MSLIAGNNAVYNFLQHRTLFHLYAISLACTAVFTGAGFFFFYLPLQSSIDLSQSKVAQMRTQLKTMNGAKQAVRTLQESVGQLQQSLKGYVQNRTANLIMNDAVIFLTDCASAHKLTIGACRLCTKRDKSWCSLNQITGQFSGTMDQLVAFFGAIQKSSKLIKCKKFELTKKADETFALSAVFQVLIVV